ncbi:MAG TPA: cupin domain-containing protein [Pirellulaceae bacterium]|nr:cupin domain-containing protein [Pirellulaceae bacterium]HMO91002.1 cupin domain-containing protein [Pirellulaceae bacterium]HMP68117.1 cupin domain-containing protein [Pirellulaceae bacterium]
MLVVRGQEIGFTPASHEDFQRPGVLKKVLATREAFVEGRVQMLNWSLCPKGSAFRKHFHEDMQETFVILNGAVRMEVAGETVHLQAGDAILIEAREVHQMFNIGDEDVTYIVFGISTGQNGRTILVDE